MGCHSGFVCVYTYVGVYIGLQLRGIYMQPASLSVYISTIAACIMGENKCKNRSAKKKYKIHQHRSRKQSS